MRSISNDETERALLQLEDNYRLSGNEPGGSNLKDSPIDKSKILPAVASGQSTTLPPIKN